MAHRSIDLPEGTPPGEYEIVVCFFDSDSDYSRREDAFYEVRVKITVR